MHDSSAVGCEALAESEEDPPKESKESDAESHGSTSPKGKDAEAPAALQIQKSLGCCQLLLSGQRRPCCWTSSNPESLHGGLP